MSIISKETFEKFSEEEKKNLIEYYKDGLSYPNDLKQSIDTIEFIFGKENLQPEPQIKTWKDMKEEHMLHADTGTSYIIDMDKKFYSEKLALKALATLQIAKLIELGYGGMVTDEEWKDDTIKKYCVCVLEGELKYSGYHILDYRFIAFHTSEQREEFMSYPENRKFVEQYYMI